MIKKIHLLFFSLLLSCLAFAQTRTITGTVISSEDNLPLPGVSVVIENTTIGTQTDIDGRFSLEIKPDYFDAIYNLGALYVNHAARLMTEANAIPMDKIKEYDAKKAEADAALEKALPYLEQAHQMDPSDRNTMVTLKEIYARKSMLDKVKEMDAKLK